MSSPTKFFQALAEADDRIAQAVLARVDVDDAAEQIGELLHERDSLLCRVQELEAEVAARTSEREHYRAMAHQWMAQRSAGTAL